MDGDVLDTNSDRMAIVFGGALPGSGDGLLMGFGGGAKKKWIGTFIKFLKGETKVTPRKILTTMGKVLKTVGDLASKSKKFEKHASTLKSVGDKIDSFSSSLPRSGSGNGLMFGSGYKLKTYQIGKGKKRANIKQTVNDFIAFLSGKKRLKPSGLMKAASVVMGVAGSGAMALGQAEFAAPLLAGSSAIGDISAKMKQGGSGRHLSGHGLEPGGGAKKSIPLDCKMCALQHCKKQCKPGSGLAPGGGALVGQGTGSGLFPLKDLRNKCVDNLRKQTLPKKNILGKKQKKYTKGQAKGYCNQAIDKMKKYVENYDPQTKVKYELTPSGSGSGSGSGIVPGGIPKKMKAKGSKHDVYYGLARHTGGGLKKQDLMLNKHGKVISKKMHARGKQLYKKL